MAQSRAPCRLCVVAAGLAGPDGCHRLRRGRADGRKPQRRWPACRPDTGSDASDPGPGTAPYRGGAHPRRNLGATRPNGAALPVPARCSARDADGFLDTFYPCRTAGGSGALTVTGPPAGVVSMGGYRFILAGLQGAVSQLEPGAMLAAFPDGLA